MWDIVSHMIVWTLIFVCLFKTAQIWLHFFGDHREQDADELHDLMVRARLALIEERVRKAGSRTSDEHVDPDSQAQQNGDDR